MLKSAVSSTKSKQKKKTSKKKQVEQTAKVDDLDETSLDDLSEPSLTDLSEPSLTDLSEPSLTDLDMGLETDVDELEKCKILKHKINKLDEVRVEVKWETGGGRDCQCLYDMWADYPDEVEEYKNQSKCKGKLWKVPNFDDVRYFVRILGMVGGDEKPEDAKFIVLANNGFQGLCDI